ncbi:MAG: lysophospholipase [Cyanobacteria bacterium P01_G01_bin.38]
MVSVQTSHLEGSFKGAHDLELYYQAWYPSRPAKAAIALVHGLGEHCDRYDMMAMALADAGYALFGFDNQGHGRSDGQRGHIEQWQDYRDNVCAFLETIRGHEPTLPIFILGHSLGGLIVLDYVLHQPSNLVGVVVSGPPIRPVGVAKPYLVALVRLFSDWFPRLSLSVDMGKAALSRDPEVVRQTQADPLIHSVATLRWGAEAMKAIAHVRKQISTLKLPILLIHGDADSINDVSGSQELYEGVAIADKTLKIYPGNYHEPHNDLDRDQVMRDLITWLDTHLPDES